MTESTPSSRKQLTIDDFPTTWYGLLELYSLRPVHDDDTRRYVIEIVDAMAGHDLNDDQEDYLDSVSTLLSAYESQHHGVETRQFSGLEMLRSLMDEHDMIAADPARLLLRPDGISRARLPIRKPSRTSRPAKKTAKQTTRRSKSRSLR